MKTYIEWLERQVETCLEDKDLQREHWAFCQALRKYRELALDTSSVSDSAYCSCLGETEKLSCTVKCPNRPQVITS